MKPAAVRANLACVLVREHTPRERRPVIAARFPESGTLIVSASSRLSSRSATMSFAALVITPKSIPRRFTEAPDLYDLLSERKYLQVRGPLQYDGALAPSRFHS